jgi:hypothetical protein
VTDKKKKKRRKIGRRRRRRITRRRRREKERNKIKKKGREREKKKKEGRYCCGVQVGASEICRPCSSAYGGPRKVEPFPIQSNKFNGNRPA